MIRTLEIKNQSTLSVYPDYIGMNRTLSLADATPLLPERRAAQNYFVADIAGAPFKCDIASMEMPIFTLSTKPDLKIFTWLSPDKKSSLKVTPSALGRASMFDKDILIFIASQMTEGLNLGREDIVGREIRTVRFKMADYLKSTKKGVSGKDYKSAEIALEKLAGTRIQTNVATGGEVNKNNFGLIDHWRIVEKSDISGTKVNVEVVISEWLLNAIKAFQILTLNDGYFNLRKPIERRIYEIARKYCGIQTSWIIGLNLLHSKINPGTERRKFKARLLGVINAKTIPGYFISYDAKKDQVIFHLMKSKARKISDGYGVSGDTDYYDDNEIEVEDVVEFTRFIKRKRKYRAPKLSKKQLQVMALNNKRYRHSHVDLVHYSNNPAIS